MLFNHAFSCLSDNYPHVRPKSTSLCEEKPGPQRQNVIILLWSPNKFRLPQELQLNYLAFVITAFTMVTSIPIRDDLRSVTTDGHHNTPTRTRVRQYAQTDTVTSE